MSLARLFVTETIILGLWMVGLIITLEVAPAGPWTYTAGTAVGIVLAAFEEEV